MARMSTIIKRFLIREIFETIWNSVEISILSNIESSYVWLKYNKLCHVLSNTNMLKPSK